MDKGVCSIEHINPNVFVLDQGYTTAEAQTYCVRCPVTEECADYARRTGSTGVWGGKLFTTRETEPVELLVIVQMQDATPRPFQATGQAPDLIALLGGVKSQVPDILDILK